VVLTPGQAHDATQAEALLDGRTAGHGITETASDAERIRTAIATLGADALVPPHPGRACGVARDRYLDHERHGIEGFVSKLRHGRRLAARGACPRAGEAGPADRTAVSLQAFIRLVATLIGLR